MTRKEDCLREMEDGTAWRELIDKFPKSTVYDALKEYNKIAEKEYKQLLEKKRKP